MTQKRKLGPKGKTATPVRTGGAVGDPTMSEMEDWNQAGAGVDEDDVQDVGQMPNDPLMRKISKRVR